MFLFTEQTLQPGESIDMPVRFFLDSEIVSDINTSDIDEIVLSYTFSKQWIIQAKINPILGPVGGDRLFLRRTDMSGAQQHPYHLVEPSPGRLWGLLLRL